MNEYVRAQRIRNSDETATEAARLAKEFLTSKSVRSENAESIIRLLLDLANTQARVEQVNALAELTNTVGDIVTALESLAPQESEVDEILSSYPDDPCAQCGESPCSHSAGAETTTDGVR